MLNFKTTFAAVAVLFFITLSFSPASAQVTDSNPSVCKACGPSINAINVFPFPWRCDVKAFGANTSGSGRCQTYGYFWSTSDGGASIVTAGGQCKIDFSGPGTYDVCLVYTKWLDLDNDMIVDGNELCSDMECISVDVCL